LENGKESDEKSGMSCFDGKNCLTGQRDAIICNFIQTKGFIPMTRKYDNISVIPGALLTVSVVVVVDVVVGDVDKDAP